ncbi:MAG: formylglycine-generating enzyme family protein [Verrucomicrobia bacterium]|nr:formylglycine-generating enzyme family protein [Verrucomicrobiota bacterium]
MKPTLTRSCILACVAAALLLGAWFGMGHLQAAEATISLVDTPEKAKEAQAAWAAKLGKPVQWTNSVGMKFQLIPPGEFEMGAKDGEADAKPHKIKLTQPFYLGTCEVTREQWEKVTGKIHTTHFPGPQMPITSISLYFTDEFCAKLNKLENLAVKVPSDPAYRIPTEAEWEYAARAGTATRYYTGNTEKDLDRAGWYEKNSGATVHPVGQKEANAFGLHDMLGNVWEWCSDAYDKDYYTKGPVENPPGAKREHPHEDTVVRGGSFLHDPPLCAAAHRDRYEAERYNKDFGFRVVLPIMP